MMSHKSSNKTLKIIRSEVRPSIAIRAWHRIQERVRRPALRNLLSRIISMGRPRLSSEPGIEYLELMRFGLFRIPGFIDRSRAMRLKEILSSFPCRDPWKPHVGSFSFDNPPAGTHVADIAAAPTVSILHDLAHDQRLINMAAAYLGCQPYLDSIQAWWTLPGNDEPEEAENYHRDNDAIRFLKFFLYLTDVDDDHGPHCFVIGSHMAANLLERRRLTDREVEECFGTESILKITGRAGDAFMEDTFGIHKGQRPRCGRRLLVQFRYSIMPTVFRSPVIVENIFCDHGDLTSLLYEENHQKPHKFKNKSQ